MTKRMMLAVAVTLGGAALAEAASGSWVAQTYVHGPADNPLKGFLPYQGSYATFPHSMEWNYIAWKDVQRRRPSLRSRAGPEQAPLRGFASERPSPCP